uniref:Helicase ATP-binding domain-containing protein n=1 Tax=viral metagenome TaxID=1070528 RepID=A0A6C0C864_9ZZZZ
MQSYPSVDDDDFYPFVNKKFKKLAIPKEKKTMKEFCFPKNYELQIPQKFLAEFINPKTQYTGILVYHKIGSGKSCTAIHLAEGFKKHKNIMVVLPAALKGNFRNELRTPCAGNNYLTMEERAILKKHLPTDPEYKKIIKKSDERIDKYYTIYSYNKFIDLVKQNKIKLKNTLLIIDEIHNMISETGAYYELIYDLVMSAPKDLRLVIMSATPIFDKPIEIALTMNLLNRKNQMPTGSEFYDTFLEPIYTTKEITYEVKNLDLFKSYIKGYVSYYKGAPSYVFPKTELHLVKCRMSDLQYKVYKKIIRSEAADQEEISEISDVSNSFFIGTRMLSNFVYPNKRMNKEGWDSLDDDDFSSTNIKEYSPKFAKILRRIKRCEGTVFIYSNFKGYGGIKPFVRLLEQHHFKNYADNGVGKKRFAVWSGDQKPEYKEDIKAIFNKKENEDGSMIKVIIGSSSIKEGVSFLRVREVHIIEMYWNWSRMDQIMGRAIRFCSHKDVPADQRLVKVYMYLATHPELQMSIDEKILQIAIRKQKINIAFERAMKEAAVDCTLFKNGNDDDIVCDI